MNSVTTKPTAAGRTLWRYESAPDHFDELIADGGDLRAAWKPLVAALEAMGPDELQRRWEKGRRLIHENGVTYNVYGDPRGMDRPWQLDAVPLVISAEDWKQIEQAVTQRAMLLNHVLADIYGPQKLLSDGLLPAGLVYSNSGFLRPMRGVPVPRNTYLHMYAADLARSPSGKWWVVNDRTQAPSGAGYALENRLVITRSLPDVFRDCQVHRLAEYFAKMREMLLDMAPAHKENPRVVLLTPGPFNETYFEHAYLARYLGCTLVEGGDLTVRDKRVYLKTLSGLLPVDAILRRQDDSFCDPLELRDDSILGIAGLVGAVRAGNVVVANALGSSVADTPAIMAFLPALCTAILGEELKMPSVATWWCGQPKAMAGAIERLERLVIKAAYPSEGNEVHFGDQLDDAARETLLERMARAPHRFVAQERVTLSTAPAWFNGALEPRHVMVRVFATATPDGGYMVMPGGLTRVSGKQDSILVSTQAGGGSKDTWVISESPVSTFSLLRPAGQHVELSRAGFVLPSRVADNLFWLGRYAERIESAMRVVRVMVRHMTDESETADFAVLPGLANVLSAQGRMVGTLDESDAKFDPTRLEPQVLSLLFDEERPFSIRGDILKLHRIAAGVRDRISLDSWRIVTRLADEFVTPGVGAALQLQAALDRLDGALFTLAAFGGQAMEGMTREKGWRFLDIGRRIERASSLLTVLRFGLQRSDAIEGNRLEALLDIANSSMTYRSRYMTGFEAAPVLDLLVMDEINPRSLAFQLAELAQHVDQLVGDSRTATRPPEQRIAMSALTAVRLIDILALAQPNPRKQRAALVELLDRFNRDLNELSAVLMRTYLSHARKIQHLSEYGV
jgi:uncharacterized circularly permuted ATP-grasp superfamily protein/uncharacterized alpha-E superfamily protein